MALDMFNKSILEGIPDYLPEYKPFDTNVSRAPKRLMTLTLDEQKLALSNALRYFPGHLHKSLASEFLDELNNFGRIYMYRYRPGYIFQARNIKDIPHKSEQAASVMFMILNNLDPDVAQHPLELITYGGNGSVFQNWAQYRLTMQYLATMTDEQTLVLYSGHPLGLFPSNKESPRVVVTNGMVVPNYSKPNDWDKLNALGVTQYGQMTAGSFMYIGPQGIVHGTTITLLNAFRKSGLKRTGNKPGLFVSSGMGGMSGAQTKAASIAGCVSIVAEINHLAIQKRYSQGWVDEVHSNCKDLFNRVNEVMKGNLPHSFAYHGNIVDLWEYIVDNNIDVDLGSDQTSLHNPWSGGYYPVGLTFDESNKLMTSNPERFKEEVKKSLRKQVKAINSLSKKGMYFFDYGNAFLLESSRAGANIMDEKGGFKYKSYVQDIMGPLFFDYGFGPFRWICCSNDPVDLKVSDEIAGKVIEELLVNAPEEIKAQLKDNLDWIREADNNNLVVGSQARILYANAEGRIKISLAFNKAIKEGKISGPIVLGRDHHDVSGTDSPFRETSNIYDGSSFTADMAIHNVIGGSFRGATWISIHNGGGVGWGEAINGGFGLVIDGTLESERKIGSMLSWDVNNGVSRRSWARNKGAIESIKRAMKNEPLLMVTIPNITDENLLNSLF